uniref:Uncharacterized protein n=1 Tax=Pararge aegeria TaxID=116150 RepID=S4PKG1_9NEOP
MNYSNSIPQTINSFFLISGRLCKKALTRHRCTHTTAVTVECPLKYKHNDLYQFYHLINHIFITTLVVYSSRKNICLAIYNI